MPTKTPLWSLLMMTDGRLPAGAHAHSGGLEVAVADGTVVDVASLRAFCAGRLTTVGLVDAAFAAAAVLAYDLDALCTLDEEYEARHPSARQRLVSRQLGRQLARTARVLWPSPRLDDLIDGHPHGPHHAIALGLIAGVAGLQPVHAALAACHHAVTAPAQAGVRLLGLDPVAVAGVIADLGELADAVAADAVASASGPAPTLPACSAPLLELGAERHATWEVRLFAS
jgi:urease accessory protein